MRPANTAWGGARHGAGRPRTTIHQRIPADVIDQLARVAEAENAPFDAVVLHALRLYLEAWQHEHPKPAH